LYETTSLELRQYISNLISQFEESLKRQVPSEIEELATEINEIFDQIEKDSPLY